MPFTKWTLEVCTGYADEAGTLEQIKQLLDADSATPYYKSRLEPLTREAAKAEFGVPEEHLDVHYDETSPATWTHCLRCLKHFVAGEGYTGVHDAVEFCSPNCYNRFHREAGVPL